MSFFATEFPVKPIQSREVFVAQICAWLRGMSHSTVLDDCRHADLEKDMAYLQSQSGEELHLREFGRDGNFEAIGFRHDSPDNEGRLWRTEAVLRRDATDDGQDLIRLRTQCIAQKSGAWLEIPYKPYLIKTILRDGWGGKDGVISISDQPLWLADNKADLDLACAITLGEAGRYLPVIYISATGASKWSISREQIEKLAFEMGGVAHVVVEPSRSFSFRLRDLVLGTNAYGGTIAVILPNQGIIRRFHLGWRVSEMSDLLIAVRKAALSVRSQMPADGWDWTELQEQALRLQRERERGRLSDKETEELYQEEIKNLSDRIEQLEGQLATRPQEDVVEDEGLLLAFLVNKIGPEIYPGEFLDKLRRSAKECVMRAEQIGLDSRSRAILSAVADLPSSPGSLELVEDLKRATKDPKRMTSELTRLLSRHGYYEKSDNKHVKLEAREGYIGLGVITLSKTPSDGRSLANLRKDIERALGLHTK